MSNKAKVCRICMLGNIKGVISLFTLCDGTVKIYNKVMEVANIQISREDGLPTWICYTCLIHLETSYQFKVQAEKSDQLFKKQLDTTNNEDMKKMAIYTNEDPLQNRSHLRELLIEPKPSDKSFVGSDSINQDYFTNIQSGLQGHFLSEVFDVNDCSPVINSEEQNGIKITSVVSQAKPEGIEIEDSLTNPELVDTSDNDTQVVGTPSKESVCTCTEDKDGINISKCDVCTKMSSNHKPTDELTESGENEPSCSNQTASLISVVNEDGNNSSTNGTMSSNHKPTDELTQSGRIEPSCNKQTASLVSVLSEDGNNSSTNRTVRTINVIDLRNIEDKTKFNSCKALADSIDKLITPVISKNNIPLRELPEKSYACPNCKQIFPFRKTLNEHILTTHKDTKGYKCNVCGKSFLLYDYMASHKAYHETDGKYKCDECDKTFARRFHLSNHKKSKHLYGPAVCEYCGKHYEQYTGLHAHQYIHHSKDSSSCVCSICGKSFISKVYLTAHMHIHSKMNLTCDICNKTYPHKIALRKHKNLIHGEKQNILCTLCNKVFKNISTLRNHKYFKHKEGEKPKCHICHATFSQKTVLKTHMKMIHIGLTPHACKHCKQEFRWKPTCEKHERKCLEKQKEKEEESKSQSD